MYIYVYIHTWQQPRDRETDPNIEEMEVEESTLSYCESRHITGGGGLKDTHRKHKGQH